MIYNYFQTSTDRYIRFFLLSVVFLIGTLSTVAQSTPVDLAPGTPSPFIVPAGVTSLDVQAWGGGGAGGASNQNNRGGSGGGAGGYASGTFVVTPLSPVPFSVGAGGVASNVATAASGGQTAILGMIANGGGGGTRNANPVGAGGTASGGTVNTSGGNGGNGGGGTGGNGGNAPNGGNGGNGRSNAAGNDGQVPGGGGGGGEATVSFIFTNPMDGGDGGAGRIRIIYTTPPTVTVLPNCNNIGASVTITGTNFLGVTQVTINGLSVPFVVNSATAITLTVPAGATSGIVEVTKPGAFGRSAATFQILSGIPAISGSPTVCIGGTTPLTHSIPGGTWSSSDLSVATVSPSGVVSGVGLGTVTITFSAVSDGCPQSTTHLIQVIPGPVLTGPSTVCATATGISFTTSVSGGTWSSSNPAVATIDSVTGEVFPTDAGTTTISYLSPAGCQSTAMLTVDMPIAIQTEPAAVQVCIGQTASFTVDATGGSLTYQWFQGLTALTNDSFISGVTTPTLTISPVASVHEANDYYCVVTNACGSVQSANVALALYPTPQLGRYTDAICSGGSFDVLPVNGNPDAATVVPAGTLYSWAAPVVTGGMTGGVSGADAVSVFGTLTNNTSIAQTATYTVTPISADSGNCVGAPFEVVITVNPVVDLTSNPPPQTACSGNVFSFTPMDGGGNVVPADTTYSWGLPDIVPAGSVSGATTGTSASSVNQTLTNTSAVDGTATYTVTATSGNCTSSTFTVIFTVRPIPTLAVVPSSQVACSTFPIAPIALSNPNATPGVVTYNWTRDNVGIVTGMAASGSGATISGALNNTTSVPVVVTFTVTAISGFGCPSIPELVTVVVNPMPNINLTPTTQSVCSGTPISQVIITNPNGVSNTVFPWTRTNTTNVTGIPASGSGDIIGTLVNTTPNIQTVTFTVTPTADGCAGTPISATITVRPSPTIAITAAPASICSGNALPNIIISSPNGVSGTSFSWVRDNAPAVTGPVSGSNGLISGVFVNTTGVPQIVNFTATATAGTCSVTQSFQVIINPAAVITPSVASQTVCDNVAITPIVFNASPAVAGTTYSWVRNSVAGLTGMESGTGNTVSGTIVNTSGTSLTTTFTMTATSPLGCVTTATATVTVNASFLLPNIGSAQVVCAGETPTMLVLTNVPSGGGTTTNYQWQSSTVGATGPWTPVGTNNPFYQPPGTNNATPNTWYRVVATNCGTHASNAVMITVASSNNLELDISWGTGAFCSGSTFAPSMLSAHFSNIRIKYSYTASPAYVSPSSSGTPVGDTGCIFGGCLSSATLPMTLSNNTNATVTASVSITPHIYNSNGTVLICSLSPETRPVTIRPVPVATASVANPVICHNTSPGIAVTGNITDRVMTFSWSRNSPAGIGGTPASGTSGNINVGGVFPIPGTLTNSTANVITVTYTITPNVNYGSGQACSGAPIQISVQVMPNTVAGTIAASHNICYGGDPNLLTSSANATGYDISYQWYSSTTGVAGSYIPILGATSATYDPPAGLTQTTWFIREAIAGIAGLTCSTARTAAVIVTVNSIDPGEVAGDQTICHNTIPAPFTVITPASGAASITYLWQQSTTDCNSGWVNASGVNNLATYTPTVALTTTTYYRRLSTPNGVTACREASNCLTVSVNRAIPGNITANQTICPGGTANAIGSGTTPPSATGTISFQWESSPTGCAASDWTPIGGANAASYTPAGLTQTTYFRRITYSTLNGVTCASPASNCVTITVNSFMPGVIAANRTICSGGTATPLTFSTLPSGPGAPGFTYQWQSSPNAAGPYTDISGATTTSYIPTGLTQTTYYQVLVRRVVSGVACTATTNFVTVFVNQVTAPTITGPAAVCGATDPNAIVINTPASGSGVLSYQWQSSTSGNPGTFTNIGGATSATYDPPPVAQSMYYQVVATSTLNSVGCSQTSNIAMVIQNGKTWNGSINANWNTPGNWTPSGVPTAASCVVIPDVTTDPVISGVGYEAEAMTVTVLTGGNLQVSAGTTILVTDNVTVNAGGVVNLHSSASLVQTNNVANSGMISVQRSTTPMYRFDYTYWNSPVQMGTYTLGDLSPNTQYDKYYSWTPTIGGAGGNWAQESIATVMNHRKGYIVRAPNSFSFTPTIFTPYTAVFTGIPNNGNIDMPISVGSMGAGTTDDKLNLIGNPYPSAVNADLLLNDPHNATLVEGTIYFWTHHAPPTAAYPNPFYGTFTLNYSPNGYASYNATGSTGTTPTGAAWAPPGYSQLPNGYIASGQSFFAIGRQTGTLYFTNAMRVRGNNNSFFRNAERQLETAPQRDRIWLNFANTQGMFSQTLVGYVQGATNGIDRKYDGPSMSDSFALYSIADGRSLGIQGRAPFVVSDEVPLGYMTPAAGTFVIGIDHLDGLFENQDVYLEDKLLGVIHPLKNSEYSFTTASGVFDSRFVLRYTSTQLSVGNPEISGQYVAFIKDDKIHVSTAGEINSVRIFDMTGKLVKSYLPKESSPRFIDDFQFAQGVYLAKIKLRGGEIITAKLVSE